MSNQGEKTDLPQHKPGSPCKNFWLPTTSQLHFFALHNLYLRPFYTMAAGSCPKVAILGQTLLAPNDQNSIEEKVLNLATTPVKVAPVRLARLLWWLTRQAKQSLQRCWRRTSNKRHWSCNVTSAMRTGHPKKILDPLRTADDYLQVYSFIFVLCTVSIWDQFRPW